MSSSAGAISSDSRIDVSLCGAAVPAAQIVISEPRDDSVVASALSTVRGTVANATQVEIAIDGQYTGSVTIGANETLFETTVTLAQGTHTVEFTAFAVCGGQSAYRAVVLTYQPSTEPSNGAVTPTIVGDPSASSNGVAIGRTAALDTAESAHPIDTVPVIGPVISAAKDFAAIIGLEATVNAANAPITTGVARVGVTVVALTSVVMASSLAPIAAQGVPGLSGIFSVRSHRSMIYLRWVIRGVGLLAMGLAYFL